MVTIALPPEVEERLLGEASRRGLGVEELAAQLIAERLSPAAGAGALGDLFAQWEREDQTADPLELARRNRELDELKNALNRNRLDMEGPHSRRPFA
jgi:hypothetical protein